MTAAVSLRLRLIVIILTPLLGIATVVGAVRVHEARTTAEDLFDRSLLLTAIAVARDVASSDGDAITHETQQQLSDAAGGPVRYHVYAPDGVFVTGYAVPPVPVREKIAEGEAVTYTDVVHRGRAVRVLRMLDVTTISRVSGAFTITVWQDKAVRDGFVRDVALRAFAAMALLVGSLAVVVWFGVTLGLKPLLDLEDAISRRSPEDLSAIGRAVPRETKGIVERLNRLFAELRAAISAQHSFISDAAHQLRNPIAGIRALGDSILTAHTLDAAKERASELMAAAESASDLANRLLTLERLRSKGDALVVPVDLHALSAEVLRDFEDVAAAQGVVLDLVDEAGAGPLEVEGDPVMVGEMLRNLVDNALVHGGEGLGRVTLALTREGEAVSVTVADDGKGIAPEVVPKAMARFGQVQPGKGSGLGLPIAEAVARRHGGTLEVLQGAPGLAVRITLRAA